MNIKWYRCRWSVRWTGRRSVLDACPTDTERRGCGGRPGWRVVRHLELAARTQRVRHLAAQVTRQRDGTRNQRERRRTSEGQIPRSKGAATTSRLHAHQLLPHHHWYETNAMPWVLLYSALPLFVPLCLTRSVFNGNFNNIYFSRFLHVANNFNYSSKTAALITKSIAKFYCNGEVFFVFTDLKSYDSGEIVCRIPDQLEVAKNFTVLGKLTL